MDVKRTVIRIVIFGVLLIGMFIFAQKNLGYEQYPQELKDEYEKKMLERSLKGEFEPKQEQSN